MDRHALNAHILIALAALFCSGCVDLRQEIVLHEDNTGTFTVTGAIPAGVYRTHAQDSRWTQWLDPGTMGAICSEEPSIELDTCRVFQRDGKYYLRLEGKMKDAKAALATTILGGFKVVTTAEGMEITLDLPGPEKTPDAPVMAPHKPTAKHIESLVAGMRLDLTIEVPNEVIATSAPFKRGKAVRWVFDANKDPAFLHTPPQIRLVAR